MLEWAVILLGGYIDAWKQILEVPDDH